MAQTIPPHPTAPINTDKKWLTLEEAAAILNKPERQAHGLMLRNSIVTNREGRHSLWSARQVKALAERENPTKPVVVAAAHPPHNPIAPSSNCANCGDVAHFTGTRQGNRVSLCSRCFRDASFTGVRSGTSAQVVTA